MIWLNDYDDKILFISFFLYFIIVRKSIRTLRRKDRHIRSRIPIRSHLLLECLKIHYHQISLTLTVKCGILSGKGNRNGIWAYETEYEKNSIMRITTNIGNIYFFIMIEKKSNIPQIVRPFLHQIGRLL